jgi:hypothetical protein
MQSRWVVFGCRLGGALFVAALFVAVPGIASAHEATCHTDRTCPSDVSPPDYVCGDNPTTSCSAPNSPVTSEPNAAPQLNGPPTPDDCGSYEIFYRGSICKQALGMTTASPSTSGSPGVSGSSSTSTPTSPALPTPTPTDPFTAFPSFGALPTSDVGNLATAALIVWAFSLAASVFMVVSMWRVFAKAGEPGWAAIVPIYNTLVYLKITRRPWWWIFILWLIVPLFIVNLDLAKAFGRSSGFGIGLSLVPFVFLPILGFGPARYRYDGPRPQPLY